ncbi:MAG TPA: heparinase II/III family protein, partial [Bryobacteraceae bacterium]
KGKSAPMTATDSKVWEFLWRDTELKPEKISDLPLSLYYPEPYGWMTARTGWDENSVIAQMRMNVYNFGGHQHADAGSFELYYKGPLAVHGGVYQGVNGGFGSAHHRNYYQRTIAHNSLLIYDPNEKFGQLANDGGQRMVLKEPLVLSDVQQPEHRTAEVLSYGIGPDQMRPAYTYLKGDITKAYSGKVREVVRSEVFLNLGGEVPAALIVFDRVTSTNPSFRKYWLLQSVVEPKIDGDAEIVSLGEHGWSGKLWNTTLLPRSDNASIEKVGGPGKEFWVFGKNYPNSTVPPDPEMGGWRIEVSPKKAAATDLFLNVMQVMDRSVEKPLAMERIESGDVIGVKVGNRAVVFNSAKNQSQGPVKFDLPGNGPVGVLVTDLAEGRWKMLWNGHEVRKMPIDKSGTTYFDGPPGSFEFVKQ